MIDTIAHMVSDNGNPVPSQFVITLGQAVIFQSYEYIIAIKAGGNVYIDPDYIHYSRTTEKYLYRFLGTDSTQFDKCIENGEYIRRNLSSPFDVLEDVLGDEYAL